jgi:formate-dependent nitrite reductase membrane component NrfD
MAIFLIFGCETIVFSFLIGAFMGSFGLGMVILGGAGLIMYALFQRIYTLRPLIWGTALLAGFATILGLLISIFGSVRPLWPFF